MKKVFGILLLCLTAFCAPLFGQEGSGLVLDLGLLGGPRISRSAPPTTLNLGVELTRDAPFKLIFKENVIDAGLMNRGFNVIPLDFTGFFQTSGTYLFILEFMTGRSVLRQELSLHVEVDQGRESGPDPAAQTVEPKVSYQKREYSVSLYVDQRLVAVNRKKLVGKISLGLKLPPLPHNYDPSNPDAHRDPLANTVSILDALGLAVHMAVKLLKKPENSSPANPLRPLRQIQVEYLRRTPQGLEKPVSATLTLTVREVKRP